MSNVDILVNISIKLKTPNFWILCRLHISVVFPIFITNSLITFSIVMFSNWMSYIWLTANSVLFVSSSTEDLWGGKSHMMIYHLRWSLCSGGKVSNVALRTNHWCSFSHMQCSISFPVYPVCVFFPRVLHEVIFSFPTFSSNIYCFWFKSKTPDDHIENR